MQNVQRLPLDASHDTESLGACPRTQEQSNLASGVWLCRTDRNIYLQGCKRGQAEHTARAPRLGSLGGLAAARAAAPAAGRAAPLPAACQQTA